MLKQGDRVTSTIWPKWRGTVASDQRYEQLVSVQWDWSSHGPSVEFSVDRHRKPLIIKLEESVPCP